MNSNQNLAGKLSLAALVLFVVSVFLVWSAPSGITKGPVLATMVEPAMLALPALGMLGALLGTALGLKGMKRGLGIGVLVLGTLNLLAMTALLITAGAVVREGLFVVELASCLVFASGLVGTFNPARKQAPASADHDVISAY